MSKHIIDFPDGVEWGVVTCRTEDGFYTRDFDSLEELNSDYINEHYGELQDEAYQRGLEDAWEAARKLSWTEKHGGYGECLDKVFDRTDTFDFLDYSPNAAITKLKAYEERESNRIEVGDIVERYIDGKLDSKGIYLQEDGGYWRCLFDTNGVLMTFAYPKEQFKKTGKHYDIASILEAMRNTH